MRSIFIYLHQIVYFVKQRKHFARFHVFLLYAAILTLSLLLLSQQTGTEGEENGNDPSLVNQDGQAPLDKGEENGNDPSLVNQDGQAPLDKGEENGNDPSLVNQDGQGPLDKGEENGNDPSLVNQDGQAPLDSSALPLKSHLYALQQHLVSLEKSLSWGGAIEPLGDTNTLLVVMPRGRIALVHPDGETVYMKETVPMNQDALRSTSPASFSFRHFRVADILLHEQSSDKFTLFVSHHYFAEDCLEFRISSTLLHLDSELAMTFSPWKTVFIANPCLTVPASDWHMSGGGMLMDGAEHLLIVTSDHGVETITFDQPDTHFTKLVRIHVTTGTAEILASGLRNPQGFARDADGTLWATDHGPHGGDELNILRPSLNYGWPYVTHGLQYGSYIWPYNKVQGRHDGFEMPVFSWTPAIAPTSLIVSDSPLFPLWKNDLLIASLRAQSLFRVRLHEKRVVYVEQIHIGRRIRDITQMPDGRIALLIDAPEILFLKPFPGYCIKNHIYTDSYDDCIDILNILDGAGEPVIRSNYDVYINETRLIYFHRSCSLTDFKHRFFLHITPVHLHDLPEDRKQHGFDNLDFSFNDNFSDHSFTLVNNDTCIVVRHLPQYDIKQIRTGQFTSETGPIWEGEVTCIKNHIYTDYTDSYDDCIDILNILDGAGEPVIRSNYDVYINETRLIYFHRSCSQKDTEHKFFIHITPVHLHDLPEDRKQYGFDNINFSFNDNFSDNSFTLVNNDTCIVVRYLPQYDIKQIKTGQFTRETGPIWEGEVTFGLTNDAPTPRRDDTPLRQDDNLQSERSGPELFAAQCASCHNLSEQHSIGPHLAAVIGRRSGRVPGYNTSAALTSLNIVWTRKNLAEFILNPSQFAPGTSMSAVGTTPAEAQSIADFLASTR